MTPKTIDDVIKTLTASRDELQKIYNTLGPELESAFHKIALSSQMLGLTEALFQLSLLKLSVEK